MKTDGLAAPRGAGGGTGDDVGVAAGELNSAPAGVGEHGTTDISAGLAGRFEAMEREACIAHWIERFGKTPPKYVSVRLMRRALAHEEQIDAHGGLVPSVRKRLRDVLGAGRKRGSGAGGGKPPAAAVLRPGTHLVREWNGRTYTVEVTEDGFRMDARHYRSLSAIARRITGTHWSGPRFFALVRR